MFLSKKRDIVEAFDYFISLIQNPELKKTCKNLKNYPDFWTSIASLRFHHNFESGLIIHTLEVTDLAVHTAEKVSFCNLDILIASCLWHDLAKIWEYRKLDTENWGKNETYSSRVGHISGSLSEFSSIARTCKVSKDIVEQVQHCILSHHGRKEWGSPVSPISAEAIILHNSDMISAMCPKYLKKIDD